MSATTLLTTTGAARINNAIILGEPLALAEIGVSPQAITPSENMTALPGEAWRGPLVALSTAPGSNTQLLAETHVPVSAGPFWMRSCALYDTAGNLIAVGTLPPLEKVPGHLSATVSMVIAVGAAALGNLTAPLAQGLATQTWASSAFIPNAQKGQPSGVATLDADGKLSASQRPPAAGGGGFDGIWMLEESSAGPLLQYTYDLPLPATMGTQTYEAFPLRPSPTTFGYETTGGSGLYLATRARTLSGPGNVVIDNPTEGTVYATITAPATGQAFMLAEFEASASALPATGAFQVAAALASRKSGSPDTLFSVFCLLAVAPTGAVINLIVNDAEIGGGVLQYALVQENITADLPLSGPIRVELLLSRETGEVYYSINGAGLVQLLDSNTSDPIVLHADYAEWAHYVAGHESGLTDSIGETISVRTSFDPADSEEASMPPEQWSTDGGVLPPEGATAGSVWQVANPDTLAYQGRVPMDGDVAIFNQDAITVAWALRDPEEVVRDVAEDVVGEVGPDFLAAANAYTNGAIAGLTTDAVPEGASNRYFTEARVLNTTVGGESFTPVSGSSISGFQHVLANFQNAANDIGALNGTVATYADLPSASSNAGRERYVTAARCFFRSDGTAWVQTSVGDFTYAEFLLLDPADFPSGMRLTVTDWNVQCRHNGTRFVAMHPFVVTTMAPGDILTGTPGNPVDQTIMRAVEIPSALVGTNGAVISQVEFTHNNNSNTKTMRQWLSDSALSVTGAASYVTRVQTTLPGVSWTRSIYANNSESSQYHMTPTNVVEGQTNIGSIRTFDMTTPKYIVWTGQLSDGIDTLTLRFLRVTIEPGW